MVENTNQVVEIGAGGEVVSITESATAKSMKVYRKKATFKGAKETDFYFSATRSDGIGVIIKFKCKVLSESMAFEISDVIGTLKNTQNEKNGKIYNNFVYYVTSCTFSEIQGEPLPL